MARLIDANKLLKKNKEAYRASEKNPEGNFISTILFHSLNKMINDAETVDAVEVVHGRWIGPTRVDANNNKYECSECGFWGVPGWVACPKCGAKMDSGENM